MDDLSRTCAKMSLNQLADSPDNSVTNENSYQNQKRSDYLSWNDYFMNVALLSAQRSKDPSTQVGACIVDPSNKIVGIGYNGMPTNCDDNLLPWGKGSSDPLNNKYLYVCHAELNAILNKNAADLKGCTLYVTLFPCNECAKVIIQSRIAKIWYMSDKNSDKVSAIASKRLLKLAGIEFEHHKPKAITLNPDFV